MFLFRLNRTQKEAFLCLCDELVNSDNELSHKELYQIKQMRYEMQIETTFETPLKKDIGSLNEIFFDSSSKMICLMELIGLGYIDGKFCAKEREFIEGYCKETNIPISKIEEVDFWVKQVLNLTQTGESLINSLS